ncbi:hypothetical protein BGW36DRAFT_1621 [Talaromyces proteolyticus]|uniref:Uncharacterized protein n=1 Tax=Talaromyces proteolyticus TaxID=1131652 RepID=A0AAD4L1A3_9EURO|nr:uncharacterized protein BGW36DRAFT_1621 [Talaromyces proteolyticus]KAH8704766.1 hypothetical protein BGW36DRAFT_1621 [Talaromyces proteolyticus]
MEFLCSLLPIAISSVFSMRSASLMMVPTGYVSFFGLTWLPWHDDLPFRVLSDAIIVAIINAILSLLAPRFPRLLAAYKDSGGSPKLPLGFHKLHPNSRIPAIAFITVAVAGWLVTAYGLSLPYKFVSSLALISMIAGIVLYYAVQLVKVFWIYVSHYPEMPPLGLVTGMFWPPMHPFHRFLVRASHRVARWLEGSPSQPVVTDEHKHNPVEE